jgi:inosine/xanthosine triphosphatase
MGGIARRFLFFRYNTSAVARRSAGKRLCAMLLEPLLVAVGSTNPIKIEPVRSVLARAFPAARVLSLDAPSSVPAQPLGLEQVRLGAQNRAANALHSLLAQRDQPAESLVWGVGLESGVEFEGEVAWLSGAAAILAGNGRASLGWSPRLALPPSVAQALRAGGELGPIMDELTGVADSKKKLGAIGFLTNELAPRGLFWEIAFACALAPFLHPALYP